MITYFGKNIYKIFEFNFVDLDYTEIISIIDEVIKKNDKLRIFNVNASIILKALSSPSLLNNFKKQKIVFMDGIGVFIALKCLFGFGTIKHRVTGTDLYYKLMEYADIHKLRVFFIGGCEEAASKVESVLETKFPNIGFCGVLDRNNYEKNDYKEILKQKKPHLLFVGLGTPKQEDFICNTLDDLDIPIQLAVGSGIEFLADHIKRAPKIFRIFGIEWLFRLFKEPQRLWRRYIIGIPQFTYLIFKTYISNKFKFSGEGK
ncbi:MAG: WecB/TagA/CpsF family glycosyltransferase [Melioribacteraceae bacterium]|nr:WecB/TagA/CpsF family glycosyltransferase [Melioribacteraceae bacterium]